MISVTDLRAGTTYEEDGQLLVVVSYEHIKMGRGSANIKVKIKNVRTGSFVAEFPLIPGAVSTTLNTIFGGKFTDKGSCPRKLILNISPSLRNACSGIVFKFTCTCS